MKTLIVKVSLRIRARVLRRLWQYADSQTSADPDTLLRQARLYAWLYRQSENLLLVASQYGLA